MAAASGQSHQQQASGVGAQPSAGTELAVPGASRAKDLEFARKAIERTHRRAQLGKRGTQLGKKEEKGKPAAMKGDWRAKLRGANDTNGSVEAQAPAKAPKGDIFEGEGVDEDNPAIKSMGAHMLDGITDGAEGQEGREPRGAAEHLQGGGEAVEEGHEGLELAHGTLVNPTLSRELAGGDEAGLPWIKAAMAPAIVQMLLNGRYADAVKTLALEFSPSEYFAGLEFACKKLGLEGLSEMFGRWAAGFAGTVLNVLLVEVLWAWEGFKQIKEAHEAGDRDNRIRIYSSAFAEAFLYGDAASPKVQAVTNEEREAVALGLRDGRATARSTGEMAPIIGQSLLNKFGGAENVKRAIIDALFIKAGMTGYKLHEGI